MFLERLPGKVVSATAFVRNFGAYARNAGSEPIHILNHGRPAWSLITTDYLNRLAKAGAGGSEQDRVALAMILDTIPTLVIMTDGDLQIVRINSAARHALRVGDEDVHGTSLSSLIADQRYQFVLRAVERVGQTGITETLDVDTVNAPPRTYHVKVERHAEGVAIFADETTAQTLVRDRYAVADAYEDLMDALPGLARGTINARGVIATASQALADLVQTDPVKIAGMRLSSLFHTSVRTDVADAIEKMLNDRIPFTIPAKLQAGGIETMAVMLSAAPHPAHGKHDGAIFLLQKQM
ncbi:PAS domain-containing protein [Sphingobium sufflavum]|uniref:PAS domain-containing protein n=1 Tax=Sphingobium sufflavum TaxID=1129547 RepID=UPI001F2E5D60|nr:PAS domain-containing protein [Sphingobium sufflavum]MCE7797945.1 PAS domain-containing protein [Sphingobium sufflavum]